MRLQLFRERTVQCLVLGQYTRGGAHTLEALVNYANEMLLFQDADVGVWLLVGMMVQLALSMGYHRDPRNFPRITPFAGEMRRRVWAAVMQMDLRLSNQMGLPRLLKPGQSDTAEPRNLLDSDFNAETIELPPSRPETEVTPVLYVLVKNRIDSISGLISDLIADIHEHTYQEIMELDQKLRDAEASFPPIFRWQPLSQSLMVPPQIILRRILLKLTVNRLAIGLHRKYIAQSHAQPGYEYSRNACIDAAVDILELQLLFDEETQTNGLLHPVHWFRSSMLQTYFLLGMSFLCYYMQLAKARPDIPLDEETRSKILSLLRNTYPIWLRLSTTSRDAQQAVKHLNILLEHWDSEISSSHSENSNSTGQLSVPRDDLAPPDQVTWDGYQGNYSQISMQIIPSETFILTDCAIWLTDLDFIVNFPTHFDTDFVSADMTEPHSMVSPWGSNF